MPLGGQCSIMLFTVSRQLFSDAFRTVFLRLVESYGFFWVRALSNGGYYGFPWV